MKTATIQIRIDPKTKKEAMKILDELGLDLSSGATLFYKRLVHTGSFPFDLRTENNLTPQEELRLLRETSHALKSAKRFTSPKELLADLNR